VKPIKIKATLSNEKFAFFRLLINDSDFPLSDSAGSGAKIASTPSTAIIIPATSGSVRYDIDVPATSPKKNGIKSCATEINNLIPIVAIPVYLYIISATAGYVAVSKKEFAIPPRTAATYATCTFGEKAIPTKKIT